MWGTCKIVNVSWLLFSTLVNGQNLLTQKNTLSKWAVNEFYCVNGLPVGLCILCKNDNIPMWGKHRCRIRKEVAIHLTRIKNGLLAGYVPPRIAGASYNCLFSLIDQKTMLLYLFRAATIADIAAFSTSAISL